ncbi:hypothetical protein [Bacillus pinisoli]|uniref:hypothetical protein n=1 Tax=Bacillus pinisoli TaxID=2901866 RepID=UPI001FF3542E|nr:hypothetical protein [Bacillus pinisoli]
MLITKGTYVRWNSKNKRKFVELGYKFTKMRDWLPVKVEHLAIYSDTRVDVICDYCLEEGITERKHNSLWKAYSHYLKEQRYVEKDCCDNCKYKKYRDVLTFKQHKGMLTIDDDGYWTFEENRLKELESFILKHKTIHKMKDHPEGKKLYHNLTNKRRHQDNTSISTMAIGIAIKYGLEINVVAPRKSRNYYQDEFVFYEAIRKIIAEHNNVFPSTPTLLRELKVGFNILEHHGGIYEIKRKLGLNNKEDLRDNSGFYNSSKYEVYVANYLFENKIPYSREEYPFQGYDYRSDFFLPLKDGGGLHVEVWGFERENTSSLGVEYNATRIDKEKHYADVYKNAFISIEGPATFDKNSYKKIQESLYDVFSKYLHLPFKYIEQSVFIPSGLLTNEELFNKVMELSDDTDYVPETTTLVNNGYRPYYNEIIKRFDTYEEFASTFNMKTRFKRRGYWDKEKIQELFLYMLENYGYILTRTEIISNKSDEKIKELSKRIAQIAVIDEKLDLFDFCIRSQKKIPEKEIKWLVNVSENRGATIKGKVSENQQAKAQNILNELKVEPALIIKKANDKTISILKEELFGIFKYMLLNYGQILSLTEYLNARKNDYILNRTEIYKRIRRKKLSMISLKLEFYQSCIEEGVAIPPSEVYWIRKTARGITGNQVQTTSEERAFARKLRDKLRN